VQYSTGLEQCRVHCIVDANHPTNDDANHPTKVTFGTLPDRDQPNMLKTSA
jgi:hypothetical protein